MPKLRTMGMAAAAVLASGLCGPLAMAQSNPSKVTITWLTTYSAQQVAPVVSGFEKAYPNIAVKVQTVPFSDYFSSVLADMQAKSSAVDILSVDAPEVPEYTIRKYVRPLNHYISKSELQSLLIPAAVKTSYYNGTLSALPQFSSSHVLYYNKAMFAAHHIAPPSLNPAKPWTWEQVAKVARELTVRKDGTTKVWGLLFEQENQPYETLPLPESLGANPLNFNSPGWSKAMSFYYDLYHTWKVSDNNTGFGVTSNLFATGHAAMIAAGEWDAVNWAKSEPKLSFGYAAYPDFQGGSVAVPTDSWHDGVAEYSKHVAQDVTFLKYLSLGKGAWIDFTPTAAGNIPAFKPILHMIETSPTYRKFPYSIYKLAAEEERYAVPRPITPNWDAYQTLTFQMFDDISTGTAPSTALQKAQTQWNQATTGY